MVRRCCLNGLSARWEQNDWVRGRLREGLGLVCPIRIDRKDLQLNWATNNAQLLTPILERMAEATQKLPAVGRLRGEIATALRLNNCEVDAGKVDEAAWDIRKMLTYVKRRASRKEVSHDTQLKQYRLHACNT